MSDEKVTKVVTGKVRFSYAHVFEPTKIGENDEKEKYSISLIIPKTDKATIAKIKQAIANAAEKGAEKVFGGKVPKVFKNPLRDGDEEREGDEAYANAYFVNANSNLKPKVVDKNLNAILDIEEFYSGCYGRASIEFYAFNKAGNKGVACGLLNLQKLEDGEALGGSRSTPEADFGDADADDMM